MKAIGYNCSLKRNITQVSHSIFLVLLKMRFDKVFEKKKLGISFNIEFDTRILKFTRHSKCNTYLEISLIELTWFSLLNLLFIC